ncbi:class I SAM-dependent methyltransferase [Rhodococcus sp. UNC363MFTsu5.1]|uniref:class I SAM-dependent methyltransferase n=1 Tax=Rhodococcus sp. UNC363MFTsu5.1 TaxID=1449069 RepID=UPI00048353BE|nr:class I SAM-dependent methyltransferase [Rhodococcus sp. UNC363MFTsu5.1]
MSPAPDDGERALERARALLRPDDLRASARADAGYLDLLRDEGSPRPTAAQHAMNNRLVAAVYERAWRPVWTAVMGANGLSAGGERAKAAADLGLGGEQRVLDVACGPGNFTRYFGERLAGEGVAVGFDISRPMLDQAVRTGRGPHAAYVRGDARRLPFDDGTFDAVCCYAALYLVPEPMTVVDEMIRVLAPGGRIAVMTSYGREHPLLRSALGLAAGTLGVRMYDRATLPEAFAAAGLIDVAQQIRGVTQFVNARRP